MKPEKEIIVGGQAVIEGVMMRAPNSYAVAVRRQDGTIVSKSERLPKLAEKYPILRVPILRGGAVLIHSMLLGIKAINFSATVVFEDQSGSPEKKPAVQAAAATGTLMTTTHELEMPLPQSKVPEVKGKSESGKAGAASTAAGSIAFALF